MFKGYENYDLLGKYGVNTNSEINIFLRGKNNTTGGNANGRISIKMVNFYNEYITYGLRPWIIYPILCHEMGHVLELNHTFPSAQFSDIPQPDDCNWLEPTEPRCSNNLMGYNKQKSSLSLHQLGYARWTMIFNKKSYIENEVDLRDKIKIVVDKNTSWLTKKYIYGNVIIKNGTTLIIKDSEINLADSVKIIVEENAKLIIDGATLKSFGLNKWHGIVVSGKKRQHQYIVNGVLAQGYVELKNNTNINNAIVGIENFNLITNESTGGIVKVDKANFFNCDIAVKFNDYRNFNPNTGRTQNNISIFKGASFVNNIYNKNILNRFVSLRKVNGIQFWGCSFVNTANLNVGNLGTGIFSEDATFSMDAYCQKTNPENGECYPTHYKHPFFHNLNVAVSVINTDASKYFSIKEANFEKCGKGVNVYRANNFFVGKCNFTVGSDNVDSYLDQFGIYAENSTGYKIEENTFNKNTNKSQNLGIYIKDSGEDYNELYKNELKNLNFSIYSDGKNRSSSNAFNGLQFLCNKFYQSPVSVYNDVFIKRVNQSSGVRLYQGEPGYTTTAAGNEFYSYDAASIVNNSDWNILYYQKGANTNLMNYTPGKVIPLEANQIHTCPSNFGNNGSTQLSEMLKTQYQQAITTFDEYNQVRNQFIDGGNTEDVLWDVNTKTDNELVADLNTKTPFLSDTVVKEIIKSKKLNSTDLLQILLKNPEALRNENIMQNIKQPENNIPQSMIDVIENNKNKITYRTIVEGVMAESNRKAGVAYNQLLWNYKNDTIYNSAEIENMLLMHKTPAALYELADMYVSEQKYNQALDLLQNMPNLVKLSDEMLQDHVMYIDIIKLRIKIESQGVDFSNITADEKQMLLNIRNAVYMRSSSFANVILCNYFGDCRQSDIETSNISNVISNNNIVSNPLSNINLIKVTIQPNPVVNDVSLLIENPQQLNMGDLVVFDYMQNIKYQVNINSLSSITFNAINYVNGIYSFIIKSTDGQLLYSGKFLVNK